MLYTIYTYLYVYTCMYVYTYIYIYIHMYIYIHTHKYGSRAFRRRDRKLPGQVETGTGTDE